MRPAAGNDPRVLPSRRLRVLLVPSAYYPHVGGIEELTRQLALALSARGHDISVLTNQWPAGVPRSEVLDGIEVTRLAFPLPAMQPFAAVRFLATSPAAALALLRHIRRWRPDVVHVIGAGPPSVYLAMLHSLLGARLVFTAQGEQTFDAHGIFERSATLRAGLRRVLGRADAVTACSAFVMRNLVQTEKIRAPTYVIPNGVEPDEFADASPERDLGPYVLAVGRLVPQKGFDVLVDAFASNRLTGLNLVLVGEGFERARLEARAVELGLDARVQFLGSVGRPRLAQLLRGASVFAFPSRGEPFGIALLEAMAAGLPAVAAAAGGVPEFARDGENALLVQPEDASGLAKAIARIVTDRGLRDKLIVGGRATATRLAWRGIANRYEDVYVNSSARGDA
jgi:glycosyltransferase involved in cell wall biosynthesis